MHRVFNMGLGMLVVVRPEVAESVLAHSVHPARVVGEIVRRQHEAVEFI